MFLKDLTERLIHLKRDLDNLRNLYGLVERREIRDFRDQSELQVLERNDAICPIARDSQHVLVMSNTSMAMGKRTTST